MENELQKTESPLMAAASLVQADGNMDVEKLSKLLEMQERWDATQAKKAYVVAMSEFKKNPPEILKDKTVSYKQTSYNHASLGNVTACINKALCEHGLTASWQTGQVDEQVNVICKITHVDGHSEETSLSAAPDSSGSKNPIQAIGSTVTYLQRYTLLALTGLATYEQDDDGGEPRDNKPDIPEMTATNKKALAAICVILKKSVEGRLLDTEKIAMIFYGYKGYPENVEQAGAAAAWLISLGRQESWLKPASESDKVFNAYCKHHQGQEIIREKFNACVEGCNMESNGETPEQWVINNIPLKNTIKEVTK